MTLPDCEPIAAYSDLTRESWLQLRRTGIGGSDAGAVMGLSKYASPLTVVLDKTGRLPLSDDENEFTEVGNLLEPIIRRELVGPYLAEKRGIEALILDPSHMYRSRRWPWMLCNPDGFLLFPGLYEHSFDGAYESVQAVIEERLSGLEIKTGSSYQLKYWGGREGDEVPDTYYCQVQHYMAVTGLSEWWIFALIGNQRVLRIVPRNDEFIATLVERERQLWEVCERDNPLLFPAPNGSDADMEALLAIGSPQTDDTADLTDIEESLMWAECTNGEIKRMTDELKKIKQRIIASLGRAKFGTSPKYDVALSRYQTSSLDKKRLEKDHPGLLEQYTTHDEAGRLYIKSKEEKK